MVSKTFLSKSDEETRELGRAFAKDLKIPTVFLLKGDLGSGKTTFVQGLAQGLGIKQRVISPTFIFIRKYKGPFYHVDLYRIKDAKDVENIGLLEILEDKNSIVAVEWAEKLRKSFCKLDKLFQESENLGRKPEDEAIKINAQSAHKAEEKPWALAHGSLLQIIQINFKYINENQREITIHG